MPTGSFQQYVVGFSLFLTAILCGVVMSWMGGMIIDGFYANNINGVQLVPDNLVAYAQSPFYTATSNMSEELYFINLFYLLCYFLPILGALLFWQSLVKYQSAEYYGAATSINPYAGSDDMTRRRGRRRR